MKRKLWDILYEDKQLFKHFPDSEIGSIYTKWTSKAMNEESGIYIALPDKVPPFNRTHRPLMERYKMHPSLHPSVLSEGRALIARAVWLHHLASANPCV